MTNILELASSHVEALRNYRVPREPIGTIAILDRLIAEIDRLRPDLASDCVAEPRRLREKLAEQQAEIERLGNALATANTRADGARLERERQSSSFAVMRRELVAEIERLEAELVLAREQIKRLTSVSIGGVDDDEMDW
jgi:multidrug resistance efflux pump